MKSNERPPAKPPQNVRLVSGDRVIPIDCRYEGWVDGQHLWIAVWPAHVDLSGGWSIQADMLPAKTGISISLVGDESEN